MLTCRKCKSWWVRLADWWYNNERHAWCMECGHTWKEYQGEHRIETTSKELEKP